MTSQAAQSFDVFAETYDRLVSLSAGSIRAQLESLLPDHGHRAVDLGCGTGHHAAILATRFEEVLGVDISPAEAFAVSSSRGQPPVAWSSGPAEQRNIGAAVRAPATEDGRTGSSCAVRN